MNLLNSHPVLQQLRGTLDHEHFPALHTAYSIVGPDERMPSISNKEPTKKSSKHKKTKHHAAGAAGAGGAQKSSAASGSASMDVSLQDITSSSIHSALAESSSPPVVRLSDEELSRRIESHNQLRMEIREREEARRQRKLDSDLARAAEEAAEIRRKEEERRLERDEQTRQRLERIQERRVQRELEHEVSKRRHRAVKTTSTGLDHFHNKVAEHERDEEERRRAILAEIRERMHVPIDAGIEAINTMLDRSKEQARQRAADLRRRNEEMTEPSFMGAVHQGRSYEDAMRSFAQQRHIGDDKRHEHQYRLAKMHEYGRVVREVAKRAQQNQTSGSQQQYAHTPPPSFQHPNAGGGGGLSLEDRRKQGDDFLRTAGRIPIKLAPGEKLAPIKSPVNEALVAEVAMVKERHDKGNQYLRELREQVQVVRGKKPKETFNKSAYVEEIKQLRVQTNLLERKLLYGNGGKGGVVLAPLSGSTTGASSSNGSGDQQRGPSKVRFEFGDPGEDDDDTMNESSHGALAGTTTSGYVDVIHAKLEMLRKLEELRRRAPRDDSKW